MRLLSTLLLTTLAAPALATTPEEVTQHYADLALAGYQDSLTTAQALQRSVATLIATPSDATLAAARVPHQRTEAFRFGNPIVDDWEGRVNAWPLDEGLIDHTAPGYGNEENQLAALNVIATPQFTLSAGAIDATTITPAPIADTLHEADGIKANVASGHHAIAFLLWGQDLTGTQPGEGARPFTDFTRGEGCTGDHCDRRAAYLQAVTDLLVADLTKMVGNWGASGPARAAVTADPHQGILAMLTGMGSLSYGELAGERIKLGLIPSDPEEEDDCLSDNTPNSHFCDGLGIRNVYLGSYTRSDGSVLQGPALADLVAAAGRTFDTLIAPGNPEGEARIMAAVNAVVAQTASIDRAVTALGLSKVAFHGSDSLDSAGAVFQ